jgi:2-hydroxy-3-oxopropionate reductase
MADDVRVGFIGLGIMGRPMARNLLHAGYSLIVRDLNPERLVDLVDAGATSLDTCRDIAAQCDVLITMLPDSSDVETVYDGPEGAFEGLREGSLAIDMSSISPRVSRVLAERASDAGAEMLDAPVSGGETGAINGTLSIMVGGTPAAFDRARPIFQALGKTVVYCGPSGSGQVVKLANQVAVAVIIEAVAEALVLGAKAGVDPERVVEVLQGGLAATRILDARASSFLTGSFVPGFRIRLHLKDLKNAMEAARETGTVLPGTALVQQLMEAARVAGRGDLDHSALITVVEDLAKFRVGAAAQRDNAPAT